MTRQLNNGKPIVELLLLPAAKPAQCAQIELDRNSGFPMYEFRSASFHRHMIDPVSRTRIHQNTGLGLRFAF